MATDTALLIDLQRMVIEPDLDGTTWASGLWTFAEILGYCEQRQQQLIRETSLVGGWLQQGVLPNQEQQPVDATAMQRVWYAVYENAAGRCFPLNPSSRAAADLAIPKWRGGLDTPLVFGWAETETNTLTLMPAPLQGGTLHLYGAVLAETLTGLGVELTIPDEWIPTLHFGVLANMLGKQGRAYDPPRAAYCEGRWQEGLQAAHALTAGLLG